MNAVAPKKATADIGRVAVKLFMALANDSWHLSQEEQLVLAGITSRQTLMNWRKRVADKEPVNLGKDTLERLSLITGIRKGIEILYPKDQWDSWIRRPNRAFGGQSPLERMLAGRVIDLWEVRRYLDANRGTSFG